VKHSKRPQTPLVWIHCDSFFKWLLWLTFCLLQVQFVKKEELIRLTSIALRFALRVIFVAQNESVRSCVHSLRVIFATIFAQLHQFQLLTKFRAISLFFTSGLLIKCSQADFILVPQKAAA
jgi:hypothetical protein